MDASISRFWQSEFMEETQFPSLGVLDYGTLGLWQHFTKSGQYKEIFSLMGKMGSFQAKTNCYTGNFNRSGQ